MLRRIADHIIYGNILIAACTPAMMWLSCYLLHIAPSPQYMLLGFGATLFTYNLDRLVALRGIARSASVRHRWIIRHYRFMRALCIAGGIISLAGVAWLPWRVLLFLGHLGLVSVLYAIPFLPGMGGRRSLRSISGLKIFLIAYVWMAATVWLPAYAAHIPLLGKDVVLLALARGIFIFAITLPFDIRDHVADKQTGLATIPGLIGIARSRWLAVACLLVFSLLSVWQFGLGGAGLGLLLSGLATMWLVYWLGPARHEYFYTGLLDSAMLVQPLLVILLSFA